MEIKKVVFHPFTAILAGFLVIMLIFSLQKTRQSTQKALDAFQHQEQMIREKELEAEKLRQELLDAEDPFYTEKVMRDELLLQNEGEKIIQLPPIEITPRPSEPTPTAPAPWQEWQELIFNN